MNKYYLGIDKTKQERLKEIESTLTSNTLHYKDLLCELVEITDDIQANKRLCNHHLKKLWEGMLQNWDNVWYNYSGYYVSLMTKDFDECKKLLLNLWHSKEANLRQRAICILDGNTSKDVIEQIITEAKNDRSKWVRSSIAGFIMTYDLKEHIDELKVRLTVEKNEIVKETLSNSIQLLENGYILKPFGDNKFIIEHRIKNGFRSRIITKEETNMYTSPEIIKKIYDGEII